MELAWESAVFHRTTQYSDPAHETRELQPRRDGRALQRMVGNSSFIDSKIPGPTRSEKRADGPSGHCARNISDVPTKHTKTNPQRPGECAWSPKPTGGNRANRGPLQSPFSPLPPVQNVQRRSLMPNEKLTDDEERAKDSCS